MTKHFVLNNSHSSVNVPVAQQNEALQHQSPATFWFHSMIQNNHHNNTSQCCCKTEDPDSIQKEQNYDFGGVLKK